jgi:hypothetical protein
VEQLRSLRGKERWIMAINVLAERHLSGVAVVAVVVMVVNAW